MFWVDPDIDSLNNRNHISKMNSINFCNWNYMESSSEFFKKLDFPTCTDNVILICVGRNSDELLNGIKAKR